MENNKLWNKWNKPPASALKTIQAGRLKGKSDISPHWRYLVMTEELGPCGIGWKYTIDKLWFENGANGEVFAFALVSLCVFTGEKWSEPIPGIGGSKLIQKEANGMHNNDEAYKMAVTDALSVAMGRLGVAGDIYMGLWDGSKYKDAPTQKLPEPKLSEWTQEQREAYYIVMGKEGMDMFEANEFKEFVVAGAKAPYMTERLAKYILDDENRAKQLTKFKLHKKEIQNGKPE